MGNHWEPGVVVDHAETPRTYKIQTDNGGEYRRNRKLLMKLSDNSPLLTNNSPLQDPPSARVNGNSPGKEQVNQAIPVAEEPVSAYQEQLMATRKHQSSTRLEVGGSYRDLHASRTMFDI